MARPIARLGLAVSAVLLVACAEGPTAPSPDLRRPSLNEAKCDTTNGRIPQDSTCHATQPWVHATQPWT